MGLKFLAFFVALLTVRDWQFLTLSWSARKPQWSGTPSIVVEDVEPNSRRGAPVYPTLSVDCVQILPTATLVMVPPVVDAFVSPLSLLNYKARNNSLESIASTQTKKGASDDSRSGENSFTSVEIVSTRGETSWLNGSVTSQSATGCFNLKTGLNKLTATLLATTATLSADLVKKNDTISINMPSQSPLESFAKKPRKRKDASKKKATCNKVTVILVVVAVLACIAMGIVFYMECKENNSGRLCLPFTDIFKEELLASKNRDNTTTNDTLDVSEQVMEKYKDLFIGEWDRSLPQLSSTVCASTEKGDIGGRVTARMSGNFLQRLNQPKSFS